MRFHKMPKKIFMSVIKIIVLFLLIMPAENSLTQSRTIDSLQKIILERRGDLNNIFALNNIAAEYARIDMVKAQTYLQASIELSQQIKNDVTLSNAWSQMTTLQMNMGKKDSAQYYLRLLKELASGNANDGIQGNYNLAAGLFYKKSGNFKEALPYMITSLNNNIAADKKNSTISSKTSVAGQYLNIGNTFMNMGDYKNAITNHLNGLKYFEESGNKRGISFCLQSICSDFIQLGQYKEAIPYNKRALDIKMELNDKRGVATSYEDYGVIYKHLNDYNKALFYFNGAMVIFHEMKLLPDEANVNMELGRINVIKKDLTQAGLYFEAAKNMALQLKDSSLLKEIDAEKVAMQYSNAFQKRSEQKLVVNLQSSIEMADINKELASYKYLADFYANNKEFDKALEYSEKWHQATDSVQSTDVQVQIKKMEEQYNFNKKEQEIVLLKKDQQLNLASLQKQKVFQYGAIIFFVMILLIGFLMVNRYRVVQRSKQIIAMEKMRNNIARDLHDDIGSTLTSINILSKMALQEEQNGNMMGASMQKIKDRSSAIMESMGDIVWAINPQNDSFEQMIFRMKEFTAEILDPLNISYHFKEEGNFSAIKLDVKKRKDFYLLFKEAVNNAAKYSNCKNLYISINQEMQQLHLTITDDGIGFNEKVTKNGNGLTNMRERAGDMNAKIVIDSRPESGTVITLDVPIT